MKRFLLVLIASISASSAHATSLHPCTPTVRAMDSIMHCSDGTKSYNIRIETLMSSRDRGCTGKNYAEYHTAYVEVSKNKQIIGKVEIFDADFEYSLGGGGDEGTFYSQKYRINLKNCVSPMNNGGLSFGN